MMYIRRNGTVKYYCSHRCFKLNTEHNRRLNPKEIIERSKR